MYGKGIFTTVRIAGGRALLWEKHLKRIDSDAAKIGIDLTEFGRETLLTALTSKIMESGLAEGRLRITLLDNRPSELWPTSEAGGGNTTLLIEVGDLRQMAEDLFLTRSPFAVNSRSPLAGVKSCNYLEQTMSLNEARTRGNNEAIRLNESDLVTSACMANVFWLRDGELFTPSLTTGCLAGTTREFVIENSDCREVAVGIGALEDAEAIFLASAGIGIVQVAEFEGKRFEKVDHPILHLLPR